MNVGWKNTSGLLLPPGQPNRSLPTVIMSPSGYSLSLRISPKTNRRTQLPPRPPEQGQGEGSRRAELPSTAPRRGHPQQPSPAQSCHRVLLALYSLGFSAVNFAAPCASLYKALCTAVPPILPALGFVSVLSVGWDFCVCICRFPRTVRFPARAVQLKTTSGF